MWLLSGKLEIPAYRQLAEPNCDLTQEGRDLCRQIEAATALPTYYWLYRYYGWEDPKRERARKCPSCGRGWGRRPTSKHGIASFQFRCDRCRLVSDFCEDPNDRYARIGEFKGTKARPNRRADLQPSKG